MGTNSVFIHVLEVQVYKIIDPVTIQLDINKTSEWNKKFKEIYLITINFTILLYPAQIIQLLYRYYRVIYKDNLILDFTYKISLNKAQIYTLEQSMAIYKKS